MSCHSRHVRLHPSKTVSWPPLWCPEHRLWCFSCHLQSGLEELTLILESRATFFCKRLSWYVGLLLCFLWGSVPVDRSFRTELSPVFYPCHREWYFWHIAKESGIFWHFTKESGIFEINPNKVSQILQYIIVFIASRRRGISVLSTTRGIAQLYLYSRRTSTSFIVP